MDTGDNNNSAKRSISNTTANSSDGLEDLQAAFYIVPNI